MIAAIATRWLIALFVAFGLGAAAVDQRRAAPWPDEVERQALARDEAQAFKAEDTLDQVIWSERNAARRGRQ